MVKTNSTLSSFSSTDPLDATIDAIWLVDTQQAMFSRLMQAMARPGTISNCRDLLDQQPAFMGVLASLLDCEVSLADVHDQLDKNQWTLLQASQMSAEHADYILCDGLQPLTEQPKLGSLGCPDFSATIIIKVQKLEYAQDSSAAKNATQQHITLTGPGIESSQSLLIDGLLNDYLVQRDNQCSAFPLGIDIIFTDGYQFSALPRTSKFTLNASMLKGVK